VTRKPAFSYTFTKLTNYKILKNVSVYSSLMYKHILGTWRAATVIALLIVTSTAVAQTTTHSDHKKTSAHDHQLAGYFDAHNHGYNGILPYYAFADMNAFIEHPAEPKKVDLEHRRRLWTYLVSTFGAGDQQPPLTGPSNRIAPGAIATLRAYGTRIDSLTREEIDGALERVLTTTPWTEFDSAYALRGAITDQYLPTFFSDPVTTAKGLCDASILELAVSHTAYSEQFLSFVGGWGKPTPGHPISPKLDIIRCFMTEPGVLAASGQFKKMPAPEIKVLLMTHTAEFGATTDGKQWIQFATTGQCAPWQGAPPTTPPGTIQYALLGKNANGADIIPPSERETYLKTVIGIDTAAAEITCFTSGSSPDNKGEGMERYKALAKAVYAAAKARRAAGWHGKLLVHTHVGEGGITYRVGDVPTGEKAREVFKSFPQIWMDAATQKPVHVEQSAKNVKLLLAAVQELKSEISDLDDYVIFRFGHVTNADMDDAQAMKRLGIEADINLESNVSTGAYYLPRLRPPDNSLTTERQQFEYNNLPAKVQASGHAEELLSAHALKYMLKAGVRTLMGSDGGGEEHSDIAREYRLAEELIKYWTSHDDQFPRGLSVDVLYKNVQDHLSDMKEDRKFASGPAN
jgi:hypothetical protein